MPRSRSALPTQTVPHKHIPCPTRKTNGVFQPKERAQLRRSKNGQPHSISVEAQKYFASLGKKAFCYDTVTKEKVLYLTFDCGWENGCTAVILDTLKEKKCLPPFSALSTILIPSLHSSAE